MLGQVGQEVDQQRAGQPSGEPEREGREGDSPDAALHGCRQGTRFGRRYPASRGRAQRTPGGRGPGRGACAGPHRPRLAGRRRAESPHRGGRLAGRGQRPGLHPAAGSSAGRRGCRPHLPRIAGLRALAGRRAGDAWRHRGGRPPGGQQLARGDSLRRARARPGGVPSRAGGLSRCRPDRAGRGLRGHLDRHVLLGRRRPARRPAARHERDHRGARSSARAHGRRGDTPPGGPRRAERGHRGRGRE